MNDKELTVTPPENEKSQIGKQILWLLFTSLIGIFINRLFAIFENTINVWLTILNWGFLPFIIGILFCISGTATKIAANYVIESRRSLGISGTQLMLKILGVDETDSFNLRKLLKLELNDRPQRTIGNTGMNHNDPDFLNARDGEYIFDLIRPENIVKINLVFYDCTVKNLSVRMFIR